MRAATDVPHAHASAEGGGDGGQGGGATVEVFGGAGGRRPSGARLFVLQLGYLGGQSSHPLRHARLSYAEGRAWCAATPSGIQAPQMARD